MADPQVPPNKDDLEREKLAIELQFYRRRQQLELDKLIADVRDWKFKIITGIISALVGVGGFFVGQYYTEHTETQKQEELRFKDAIASLSAKEPFQRISGATVLGRYIRPEKPSLFSGTDERNEIAERERTAISMLADGLLQETDAQVLQVYGSQLISTGAAAIPDIVRVNRAASALFARAAADYLADGGNVGLKDCFGLATDTPALRDRVNSLNDLLLRVEMPLDNVYFNGQPVLAKFAAGDVLMSREVRGILCREARLRLGEPDKAQPPNSTKESNNSTLIRLAQALSTSSVVLTEIMPTSPPESDLNGVSIVAGNLDNVHLERIKLRNSFIGFSPVGFDCKSCDFSYADLTHVFGSGDVSGSIFDGTLVNPSFAKQYRGYSPRRASAS